MVVLFTKNIVSGKGLFGLYNLKLVILTLLMLLLVSCSSSTEENVEVNLGPIPFSIRVPVEIAEHLIVEDMLISGQNDFTKQAFDAGALAQVYINYIAADGTMHGFAGVYYFKKAEFEIAQNPEEPPLYGIKVSEHDSMVLAVAGPQDSIFEDKSEDGKNISELYTIIYDPKSYKLL